MNGITPKAPRPLPPRISIWGMRGVMVWEEALRAFTPALGILGLFMGIALIGVFPLLTPAVHGCIVALLIAALAGTLYRGKQRFTYPSPAKVLAALEQLYGVREGDFRGRFLPNADNGMPNADNGMANGASRALWQTHQDGLRVRTNTVKWQWPRAILPETDSYGLRVFVVALLVMGVSRDAGPIGIRVSHALFLSPAPITSALVNLWVEAPDYIHQPPFHQQVVIRDKPSRTADTDTIAPPIIPVGSQVNISLAPTDDLQGIDIVLDGRQSPLPWHPDNPRDGIISTIIEAADIERNRTTDGATHIRIRRRGDDAFVWPVILKDDTPPAIFFIAPPRRMDGTRLKISWQGVDDFGLSSVSLVMRHADIPPAWENTRRIRLDNGFGPNMRLDHAQVIEDFTWDDWAGTPVDLSLEVRDGGNQRGNSSAIRVTLPERLFNHPLARELTRIRKALIVPSPDKMTDAVESLTVLLDTPAHYHYDTVITLGLSVAKNRVHYSTLNDRTINANSLSLRSTRALLMNLATHLEDGQMLSTHRHTDDLQRSLKRALQAGASAQEIEPIVQQLTRSMEHYAQEMMHRQTSENTELRRVLADLSNQQQEALHDTVNTLREAVKAQNSTSIRQALQTLQEMVRALQSQHRQADTLRRLKAFNDLQQHTRRIMNDQQSLQNETFNARRQTAEKAKHTAVQALFQAQQRLTAQTHSLQEERRKLLHTGNDTGDNTGDDDALKDALMHMHAALDALNNATDTPTTTGDANAHALGTQLENLNEALAHQGQALESIRTAEQAMQDSMMQQMQIVTPRRGIRTGTGNNTGAGLPPSAGQPSANGNEIVPNVLNRTRAQGIYNDLKHRLNTPNIPAPERDYLERLLKRF